MAGFFSKLFGGGKKQPRLAAGEGAPELVERLMKELLGRAGLSLDMRVSSTGEPPNEEVLVELSGEDEELLTEREGALLDSFQLFAKRALQHQLEESRANVSFDCKGFREEANRSLVELADRLRDRAVEQGRAVYLRALSPKDRKVVHQHLASDERVKSRSVGEGLYKKIKIYPARSEGEGDGEDRRPRKGSRGRSESYEQDGGEEAMPPMA